MDPQQLCSHTLATLDEWGMSFPPSRALLLMPEQSISRWRRESCQRAAPALSTESFCSKGSSLGHSILEYQDVWAGREAADHLIPPLLPLNQG